MQTIQEYLSGHPFFEGMPKSYIDEIAGLASNTHFYAAQNIASEGENADRFYIITEGQVALELNRPFGGVVEIQILNHGEVLGWSWLNPPFKWHFDARALTSTNAIAFDAEKLRHKIDADPAFGLLFMKRFSQLMLQRLNATRELLLEHLGR